MISAINKISKVDVEDLASYILSHCGAMSQLKLQKLVYYCEAYHLAYFEESLINDDFEAWLHGPVCPPLYHVLKEHSLLYSDVRYDGEKDMEAEMLKLVTTAQFNLITDVLEDLNKWTGSELEASTHQERPWLEAREGYGDADRCNVVIKKQTMLEFYKAETNGKIQERKAQ